ncbi:MAG: hypothetical protein LUF68_01745 [Clostridiales bacterium]|nr:hypothetical protein [Clostridiales bacterium]
MIYTNKRLVAQERTFDFGTIYQIGLGEQGRGRKMLALTCPKGTELDSGMNEDYTIRQTMSGRPRINKEQENDLYLLLSTESGYTRRGDGYVAVLKGREDAIDVMATGNGADGEAGRIGSWKTYLIRVKGDCDLSIRYGGRRSENPPDVMVIRGEKVYRVPEMYAGDCYDSLNEICPFSCFFKEAEWIEL